MRKNLLCDGGSRRRSQRSSVVIQTRTLRSAIGAHFFASSLASPPLAEISSTASLSKLVKTQAPARRPSNAITPSAKIASLFKRGETGFDGRTIDHDARAFDQSSQGVSNFGSVPLIAARQHPYELAQRRQRHGHELSIEQRLGRESALYESSMTAARTRTFVSALIFTIRQPNPCEPSHSSLQETA